MGENVLICFSKNAVVTHTARKLKNSILGSKLYWFPHKKTALETHLGNTYDTFLRMLSQTTEIEHFHYSIRVCHACCFFGTQDYSPTARIFVGTASVYNITQIYKQSLYLYVYFIKNRTGYEKGSGNE